MTPATFRELVHAFQQSRVLLTAYELDLFTAIGDEVRSSGEVAERLRTDPRATDRLMNALVAVGVLDKRAHGFANTAFTGRYLVRGKPAFMAGLMHSVHLWSSWSGLTEAVRHGTAVGLADVDERGNTWLEAFIAAMHWRGLQQADEVAALIDLSTVSRVLDVGGGSGVFAMAFARARTGLEAVVFDLPNVLPLTRRYLAEAGLSHRVTAVAGDYTVGGLGEGFDLVFLSAIVHSHAPEENRRLIANAARALKPAGQVVVQDFLVDEDRTGPPHAALFALNMLVGTRAGDTYTESEIREWMEAAGLARLTRRDTSFGTSLMMGWIPR